MQIVNVYRHFVMVDKDEQKGQKVVFQFRVRCLQPLSHPSAAAPDIKPEKRPR
jgi:hypothetical protein